MAISPEANTMSNTPSELKYVASHEWVRIEDNIEVTANGAYVQTDAPKSVQEIEEFMDYARNVRAECGKDALGIHIKLED